MILSGVHPEAPASWRRGMSFGTPASEDNAYAATLVRAALNRASLSHYSVWPRLRQLRTGFKVTINGAVSAHSSRMVLTPEAIALPKAELIE